ncbi:hypothetical protein EDD85DRAFT_945968 [Armillaria nabsnona]|nr:hypothetical protein EDD85DRAFT_945968 [Armillaria nabsnona]
MPPSRTLSPCPPPAYAASVSPALSWQDTSTAQDASQKPPAPSATKEPSQLHAQLVASRSLSTMTPALAIFMNILATPSGGST